MNGGKQHNLIRWTVLLLVLLAPVLIAGLYARPAADDYGYSLLTHAALAEGRGVGGVLSAALKTDANFYNNWQGLYVSGFVLALTPSIFGNVWYALTPVLVAGILYLCLWGAAALVLGRVLPRQKGLPAFTALLLTFAFLEGMPNQVEGLYWYNGAMNYQPFFALAVLNAALAFALVWGKDLPAPKAAALAAAGCLCSLVIGGGHQVAGLLNLMVLSYLALYGLTRREKRTAWPLLPLAAAVAGLAANVLAPGTRVRMGGFSGASLPEAVVKSFILAVLQYLRWLDVPLLCLLGLLTPLAWAIVQNVDGSALLFRRPWLAPAAAFTLVWGMLFLPSWTMGGIGAGRLLNVVWMTFVLGLAVSCTALLGWLHHQRHVDFADLRGWLAGQGRRLSLAAAAAILCLACIGGHTVKEGLDNRYATTLEALWELGRGVPQRFAAALDTREAALMDPDVDTVTIRCLTDEERPWLLYFSDVVPGSDQWGLADYYGKQSVTVE